LSNPSTSHPRFAEAKQLQQVYEDEIPPGVNDDAHFDALHLHFMQMISELLHEAL
jgi:hypothetical protein